MQIRQEGTAGEATGGQMRTGLMEPRGARASLKGVKRKQENGGSRQKLIPRFAVMGKRENEAVAGKGGGVRQIFSKVEEKTEWMLQEGRARIRVKEREASIAGATSQHKQA